MLLRCCLIHKLLPRHILYFVYLYLGLGQFTEATLQRCSWEKVFWKYAANLQENTHAEVAKQLYWNHTSVWVFYCKFAASFQNTFYKEHLWMAASEFILYLCDLFFIFSLTFIDINHITWLKQMHLFSVHFLECLLLFLIENVDVKSE